MKDISSSDHTLEYLENAMSHMVDSKAVSLDGFPCKFHKDYYGFVGNDLHQVYVEALR